MSWSPHSSLSNELHHILSIPDPAVLQFEPCVLLQLLVLAEWSPQRQCGPVVALVADLSCCLLSPTLAESLLFIWPQQSLHQEVSSKL